MFYEEPVQIDEVKKWVQEKITPAVKGIHCIIQRQAITEKKLTPEKHQVLQNVTGIVNLVESLCNLVITWNWAWKSFILHSGSLLISHHHTKTCQIPIWLILVLLQVNMWSKISWLLQWKQLSTVCFQRYAFGEETKREHAYSFFSFQKFF